jgi:hypothetical protein
MKGAQRGRDLRIGKSGEHAALLARQHFRRPQQLDQDDFEQAGKYRLLAWPRSRCLGVDHGQDAGQSPAITGTARRNMHDRWQERREKFFIDRVKFEVPADDAHLVRIIFAAPWFSRCGGRREILEGDDRRIAGSAAQDPGGGCCQQHAVAWFQALLRCAGQLEATAPADDASEDHAAVSGESPGPVTSARHVLPQQGTRAQQLDKLGQRIHWEHLMGIYNASKAALDNLTETLRLELWPQNIVLKLIEPGFVPTTRLVEKAQANAPVLTIVPPEYEAYVNQRMAVFTSEFPVELATPEDVADAILASVNDETGQLRWVVGADQAERMHMRHETSEAAYNDWTWRQFGPVA